MPPRRPAAVAAGHPATVAAATDILAAGGNAFDAITAAGFASAVTEPALTSLGGGGFLMACTAAGEEVLVDFFVDTPGRERPAGELTPHFTPVTVAFPGADQVFHAGYGSVAVPGCLSGYLHIHRRWGRLPLDRVLAPARRLATEGVELNAQQATLFGLLAAIFTLTDEGRALFAPRGSVLGVGDRFANPALAGVLDDLAAARIEGFESPALAEPLVSAMDRNDGLLTGDDLLAYRVVERTPLTVEVGGARLLTNPPPSFGATLVTAALAQAVEEASWGTPPGVEALVAALIAVGDGHRHPLSGPGPQPDTPPGRSSGTPPRSRRGTTHISVSDHDGNMAAMTTSNGSCSGVFAPGTGIQLNNIMGEEDLHPGGFHAAPPGLRVGSMMAPGILTLADGRRVALGSGGSERIRSALTLAVRHLLAGVSVKTAVEHPRLHWDGGRLHLEPGWAPEVETHLRGRYPVHRWDAPDLYFGGVHAVTDDGEAAGDPRRGGSTAIVA
jgi:gamma-glutamyltranspeptidase / glutathione hydrolase